MKKKEKIERFKMAKKIAKSSQLKDVHSVQSVQKLLLFLKIDYKINKICSIKYC